MHNSSIILSLLLLLLLLSTTHPYPLNIWPIPTNLSWPIPTTTSLSPTFKILTTTPYNHPHLNSAIARTASLLFSENYHPLLPPLLNTTSTQPLLSLLITISSPSLPLHPSVPSSYSLSISSSSPLATLSSPSAWGAIHGLATFSQLAFSNNPVLIASDIHIYDSPIFSHRGVMVDTARNYIPVKDLLRTVEAMGMNKMNVFHWHLTDSQSFPVVLPSVRELAEKGAYGEGMVYTEEDVREVVEFGLDHGVRVVPEIDMPG